MAKQAHKKLLFLCTGNYYRSRFAEVHFNSIASRIGLAWKASSRGLALERGAGNIGPMAQAAVMALTRLGAFDKDACARLPAQVTISELEEADQIVALSRAEHLPLLQERFPPWAERIEYWDVEDDVNALTTTERRVADLVARLLGGGGFPDHAESPNGSVAPVASPTRKPLVAKVGRETAGRRGKGVTTIFDLPIDSTELRELAATLKQRCGTGGTVKDGRIEIQGDQRERVIAELEKLGYKVKRVGG